RLINSCVFRTRTKESPNSKFRLSTNSPSIGFVTANMQYRLQDAIRFKDIRIGPTKSEGLAVHSPMQLENLNSAICCGWMMVVVPSNGSALAESDSTLE